MQIVDYGKGILNDFEAATGAAIGRAESTLYSEQEALAADNKGLQEALTAHSASAKENLVNARIAIQTMTDEAAAEQIVKDEGASDVLKVSLAATKNQFWKDISWLTR